MISGLAIENVYTVIKLNPTNINKHKALYLLTSSFLPREIVTR
jgi:hypothetical protein